MKFLLLFFALLFLSCSEDKNVNAVEDIEIRNVVTDLDTPWEILWGPDDKIWMTERYGRLSRFDPETGDLEVLLELEDVNEKGEGGLMGMALHPDFDNNPYVYVSYTHFDEAGVKIRLARLTYTGNTLTDQIILLDGVDGASIHDGSRLWIDEDLKLYMTIGDGSDAPRAQNTNILNGSILRMNLDGSVPDDNPIDGNLIYAYGLRNSQGLVFANNMIYLSDHGPSTDDEVNIIEAGRNYGWPNVKGYCDSPNENNYCDEHNIVEPIAAWTPTIAPAGLDFYDDGPIDSFKNSLLLMTLKDSKIVRLKLNEAHNKIIDEKHFYKGEYGR